MGIGPLELFFILILVVMPAVLVGMLAGRRGYSGLLFFLFALVLWPVALVVVLLLEDKSATRGDVAPSADLDRLQKLAELRDAGALSAEEFDVEKARILGGTQGSPGAERV